MTTETRSENGGPRPFGIPTTYKATRFRSRLEARWAAFFDLLGWSWVYEPFDADGWIPDFLIEGAAPFLVEVGPCIDRPDYLTKADDGASRHVDQPTLVLGVSPVPGFGDGVITATPIAGILTRDGEWDDTPADASWANCHHCSSPGIFHTVGSYRLRPCGDADGNNHLGYIGRAELRLLWRKAGSDVQWMRR
jgi:hypothetical protein